MATRTEHLIHARRLPGVLARALREGPDGTLEGKAGVEHPKFSHHSCGLYLAGCLAFLEGRYGPKSWRKPAAQGQNRDFNAFARSRPRLRGVNVQGLDALVLVRNALTHNAGDLRTQAKVTQVNAAAIPGLLIRNTSVDLGSGSIDFLEYVRIAYLAVANYQSDF